jgi:hypothetical protein
MGLFTKKLKESPEDISQRVARLVAIQLAAYCPPERDDLENLLHTIRTAILMHEVSKETVSAEHVLSMLKSSLAELGRKPVIFSTEEQKKAKKIMQEHVRLCNQNGFKTY